jgi:hypothetical protein
MMNIFSAKKMLFKAGVLCSLLVFIAACGTSPTSQTGKNGNGTATKTTSNGTPIDSTPTPKPPPAISLGPQTCPVGIQSLSYWDGAVPTQPGVTQVESVTCGHLKDQQSTLQALVTVRYESNDKLLDVYVYDLTANPVQLFQLQNLIMGDAKISAYSTILTAEADPASSVNAHGSDDSMTQDLFREFKWSSTVGTLVQVAFPGIFPDLTRYQAEADQAQVNQGQQAWKKDATLTAQAFGASLLHWNAQSPTTMVSGGGQHDVQAVVTLQSGKPGGGSIKLTMSRLGGSINGIWIVVAAQSAGASITTPPDQGMITSPVTLNGTGSAFEGIIGSVELLDHLNNNIGTTSVRGASGNGDTIFVSTITYKRTFTTGAEEGLLLLSEPSNANGSIAGAVFVKVLIN